MSLSIETSGTGVAANDRSEEAINAAFGLYSTAIIRDLDLVRPIFRSTTGYGRSGREGFT